MIVYDKLRVILEERKMTWKLLSVEGGLSPNAPTKLANKRPVTVDTINKVCE